MNDKNKNIDVEKIVSHWKVTSNEDFKTMTDLYNVKTFHWALFFGHISLD